MSNQDASHHEEPTPEELAAKDEQVHVPKGQSRTRFFMILGLMIFTLIIYVVPSQFQQLFQRGNPADKAFFVWKHPTDGAQELSVIDFQHERQRVLQFVGVVENLWRAYGRSMRIDSSFTENEQVARLIVLDRLARDAGVEISDKELIAALRDGCPLSLSRPAPAGANEPPQYELYVPGGRDGETLKSVTQGARSTPREFEEALRWMLRVQRFEALLSLAVEPDGAAIEAAWKKAHKEHSFDFVVVDIEASRPEADAQAPDEAGLRAWFDGLDASRKRSAFSADWKPERVSAELLVWKFEESADASKLLARYPRPEGTDLEQLAQNYYNQFSNVRFRRAEENAAGATAAERLYLPFAEVAERARSESQIHAALVDFSIELQGQLRAGTAGAEWATRAAELGLGCIREDNPKTQPEWSEFLGAGDPMLAGSISRAARGDQFVALSVGTTQVAFGRTLSRVDESAPSFDEVKDKALTEWKNEKVRDLAQVKAQSFVDLLKVKDPGIGATDPAAGEPLADAASFASKAQTFGLSVQSSGWLDQSKLERSMSETPSEVERFVGEVAMIEMMFRQFAQQAPQLAGSSLIAAADGAVVGPRMAMGGGRYYVIRKAGTREPEKVELRPKDYEMLVQLATEDKAVVTRDEMIGLKALETRYGVAFPGLEGVEQQVDPKVPPPPPAKS
ncbi:MAG: hypothetical protein IT454_08285 [Planctomycetes bacterium]|nr:hypothetical protein [Planctomycetota bacterium]